MAEQQNGRIGGGVLADNLLRNGIDLKFSRSTNTVSDPVPLLYLDVNNTKVGIKTDSPSGDLEVNSEIRSNNLLGTFANIADITIDTSQLVSNSGDLNFKASKTSSVDPKVTVSKLQTSDVEIDSNIISTHTLNTNLELRPNSAGEVDIFSNWNITGNLHATGDILFDANFTLGDNNIDTVTFEADVNSDIIPDQSNTYTIGSPTKKIKNLYSDLLNGESLEIDSISVSGSELSRRQGNIFYVSTLGDDTNVGDHQHGAFRTISHALSVADASSEGPVTIHIFPGEYEEVCPLLIPERVTIHGEDIRNTIIKPTSITQTNNIFELNQNCTIENITVKDFYSPGHAFVFANGALISERSPYIRNVTVLTQGSITSSSDPRGFLSADAGKGALVDGNVVNNLTQTPSMLFHSVTFITPGVDAITMTNGVRIEWLNSFTYFANRGMYATNGAGRTGPDGSTLEFGAEIRSIGSASVYGNFGAVADGSDTLMYLIGHNFAYIGLGKEVSNDSTLTLFDQETQQINNGRIYYTSTDAEGTFKIGNAFYVNFEDGTTSIDIDSIDLSGVSSIFINSGGNYTYIDGQRIDTGNFRISENTISTLDGDFNISPSTGVFTIDTNPNFIIPRGLDLTRPELEGDVRYNTETSLYEGFSTANLSFGGIYSDDRQTFITANNNQGDIIFLANGIETGRLSGDNINLDDSSEGRIGNFELNGYTNSNIYIDNNLITTTDSNSDLELVPNGSSQVKLENLYLYSSVIENFENTNLSLFVTGEGYVKFDTTGGVVIPFGTTAQQTTSPEVGDTRYNTTEKYLEVWTGSIWQRAAGEGEEVTADILKELTDIYTLVLG